MSRMVKMALVLFMTTVLLVLATVSLTLPMENLLEIRLFAKGLVVTIGVIVLFAQLFILGDMVSTYKNGKENGSKEK